METLVDYWYGKNRDRNLDLHKAKLEVPTQQISPTTKSQKQIEKKPKGKINKMKQNKKRESIILNKEKAILSKKLVTLKHDVSVKNTLESFRLKNINKEKPLPLQSSLDNKNN